MFSPMRMGFPSGMAGGGITQFLQPLQEYLSQQVVQQQVQPFINEVSDEAQERFNLGGTGSNDIFSGGIFNAGGSDFFSGNDTGVPTAQPYDHISSSVPPPLPAVQQPVIGNNDMYIGNDHVGDGLLMAPVPDIDQGFFDSDEYLNFMSKPQMGTQDMYMSRYFGQMGSGSLGRTQENLYEDYLRRTGQTDKIITTNPYGGTLGILPGIDLNKPTGLADEFGNIFELPSTNPVYEPGSNELADYASNFNKNVKPGSLTYMDPKTGVIAY